jgi:NMD protein affecting ribosome stability and mRNA decay
MTVTGHPGHTFAGYTTLEIEVCQTCGIMYALPEEMLDRARKNPKIWWYCPNGHHWHFPVKSDEQKLRDAQDALARERADHDQTVASLRATRGVVTKQKNKLQRVAKGVCPCCSRSFSDLKRHMASKHPDYDGQPQ